MKDDREVLIDKLWAPNEGIDDLRITERLKRPSIELSVWKIKDGGMGPEVVGQFHHSARFQTFS